MFFFNSGISFIRIVSQDHSLSLLINHGGLVNQTWFRENAWGNWLLETASAGLSPDFTCHSIVPKSLYISSTHDATYDLSRWGYVFNQCNAIVESHHKIALLNVTFNVSLTSRYNHVNNNAPQSSSRGIVIAFNGATLDFAHINLLNTSLCFPVKRTYRLHRNRHCSRRKIHAIEYFDNHLLEVCGRKKLDRSTLIVEQIRTTRCI